MGRSGRQLPVSERVTRGDDSVCVRGDLENHRGTESCNITHGGFSILWTRRKLHSIKVGTKSTETAFMVLEKVYENSKLVLYSSYNNRTTCIREARFALLILLAPLEFRCPFPRRHLTSPCDRDGSIPHPTTLQANLLKSNDTKRCLTSM